MRWGRAGGPDRAPALASWRKMPMKTAQSLGEVTRRNFTEWLRRCHGVQRSSSKQILLHERLNFPVDSLFCRISLAASGPGQPLPPAGLLIFGPPESSCPVGSVTPSGTGRASGRSTKTSSETTWVDQCGGSTTVSMSEPPPPTAIRSRSLTWVGSILQKFRAR